MKADKSPLVSLFLASFSNDNKSSRAGSFEEGATNCWPAFTEIGSANGLFALFSLDES